MACSRHPSPSRRGGFTLIELLVVIAIIGVLVALTVPAVVRVREGAARTTCANNLRQLGIGFHAFHQKYHYLPTAGTADYAAPTYSSAGYPIDSWKQDAGWGFQILPFIDAENPWLGGTAATTNTARMQAALATPLATLVCPSRRAPSQQTYKNPSFPSQSAYSAVLGTSFTVAPCDYAGCNGNAPPGATTGTPGNGVILSQGAGRNTVQLTDIVDGLSYTLLLGEKAANPRRGAVLNEDDMGYAAGFSSVNFNTIRFTSASLLPLRDDQVTGATGGAFGSAHAGSWNALMADGSVRQISYNIDATVYSGLGTMRGREIISDADLTP